MLCAKRSLAWSRSRADLNFRGHSLYSVGDLHLGKRRLFSHGILGNLVGETPVLGSRRVSVL